MTEVGLVPERCRVVGRWGNGWGGRGEVNLAKLRLRLDVSPFLRVTLGWQVGR